MKTIIRFAIKKNLSIELLKNQLSTFLAAKILCSNLFYIFLKTSFSCKASHCATYNLTLTSSDRAEICTTDTLKYPPEVEAAVLISDVFIQIYRVLNVKNLVLAKTFTYLFHKKTRNWDFWKSSKLTLRYSRRYLKKKFSAKSDKVWWVRTVARWESMKNALANFSLNRCPIILDDLSVIKVSIRSDLSSSRSGNREKKRDYP